MLHTSKSMFSSAHCKAKANEMTCILQNHGHGVYEMYEKDS